MTRQDWLVLLRLWAVIVTGLFMLGTMIVLLVNVFILGEGLPSLKAWVAMLGGVVGVTTLLFIGAWVFGGES